MQQVISFLIIFLTNSEYHHLVNSRFELFRKASHKNLQAVDRSLS